MSRTEVLIGQSMALVGGILSPPCGITLLMIYLLVQIYIYAYIHENIYIYIEREREREIHRYCRYFNKHLKYVSLYPFKTYLVLFIFPSFSFCTPFPYPSPIKAPHPNFYHSFLKHLYLLASLDLLLASSSEHFPGFRLYTET